MVQHSRKTHQNMFKKGKKEARKRKVTPEASFGYFEKWRKVPTSKKGLIEEVKSNSTDHQAAHGAPPHDDGDAEPAQSYQPFQCQGPHNRILWLSEEEIMAKWISEHPELYDTDNENFYNTLLRSSLWVHQSLLMRVPVEDLKTWWRSSRTAYGTVLAKSLHTDRRGSPHTQWLEEHFGFMKNHIHLRAMEVQLGDCIWPKYALAWEEDTKSGDSSEEEDG